MDTPGSNVIISRMHRSMSMHEQHAGGGVSHPPICRCAQTCCPPLKVLDVSDNQLEIVPAQVGWLPLSQLRLEGNPQLRMPKIVRERGFKYVKLV